MRADARGVLLAAAAWRVGPLLCAAGVALVVWFVVPVAPVAIPAADGASSLVWPLVPVLVTAAVPAFLAAADRDLERTAARSPARLRAIGLGLAALPVAVGALGGLRFDPAVVGRNTLLLTGLAVGAAGLLPPTAAWVPVTFTPIAMWLLGTDPVSRQVRGWAVLLAPPSSTPAWAAATATAMAGAALYLGRPLLTSGWWTTVRRPGRG